MTLDQLIIESKVLENIFSERKKNHFLQYAEKIFQTITIIGNTEKEFLMEYYMKSQNVNFKIVPKIELIDFLDQNELEPENILLITYSKQYKYEAEELVIKQIYRPTNLDDVIKKIKKII
jgi:hypothetical protein